jgi:hypothetical protein
MLVRISEEGEFPVEYKLLSLDQRAELLMQRIVTLEAEHYQHEITRLIASELINVTEGEKFQEASRMINEAKDAQAIIEVALRAANAQLGALELPINPDH